MNKNVIANQYFTYTMEAAQISSRPILCMLYTAFSTRRVDVSFTWGFLLNIRGFAQVGITRTNLLTGDDMAGMVRIEIV